MNSLYVLYDETCSICSQARRWMMHQPAHVRLVFVPAGRASQQPRFAALKLPGLPKELVVVGDDGRVYRAAKGWIMCLWALKRYRRWSHRLARPDLAPLADRVIAIIASRRHLISGLLGLRGSDRELMDIVQEGRARSAALGVSCETVCPTPGPHSREPSRHVNTRDPDRPGSAWGDRPPPH